MDFLQQAAGKYMGSESKPSAGGNGGGVDWNNLSALTNQYSALDKNGDGQVDAKDLMGGFFGGSSKPQAAAVNPGEKPAGYPSGGGGVPNTDVVSQLLNKFQSDHGQKFEGTSYQYELLAKLAKSVTGQNIPAPILKHLIQMKLNKAI